MITINLLPKDRRKSATAWLFNLTVAVFTLIVVGAAVAGALFLNVYVFGKKAHLARAEKQLADRAEVLDVVSRLEDYKKILDEKKKIIDSLVKGRVEWGRKLNELARLVPDRVWLERVELKSEYQTITVPPPKTTSASATRRPQQPKKVQIRTDYLHIFAVTNRMDEKSSYIGDFIARIQNDDSFFEDFDSVDFQEGQEQPWDKRDKESPPVWRFELKLKLKDRSPRPASGGADSDEAA